MASIAAGAVADADNNLNDAFSTTPLTIDTTAPTISSQSATSAITVQLETTESVYANTIAPTDFTITGIATSATVTAVEIINDTSTITLTLSAPITESDTPLISYTPSTNRIADAAGNQLAAFTEESITDNFDLTMPTVTISTTITNPTNLTTVPFTLEFSEQVTGFVIGDIATTAGTVQNLSPAPSPSATSYTFDISELVDEDNLIVSIAAGAVTDTDNNLNDAFSTESITIDTTAPTVSSASATTAITVELETTEPIHGTAITPTDFTITGVTTSTTVTTINLINGSSTITLTLSTPITGSDTPLVSYTLGTNLIIDAAKNSLAAFSNLDIDNNFDPTRPTVTISTAVTNPTNLTTIPFTLQLSEQVTGFVIGDIATTAGTVQNLSPAPSQSVTSYTFDVSGLVDEDNLVVSIAAGAVTDADNNLNNAFSTTPLTIDTTAPAISSQSATSAITVELETTEPIYGTAITPTDFTISGVATGATVTAVEIINDTNTITLTLSAPITDPDTPLVSYTPGTNRITDAAANQLAAFTEESITDNFDPTMPAVTITTAVTDPTNLTTIPFTLQFSEQVTGFVIGDIETTAGTVQSLSPAPSQSATSYTFDVTGLVDEDNLVVSIAAGAVADADNNLNDAFSTTPITIDTTAPTISSQSATSAITVQLETTEPVYGTAITPTDFTISGVATSATVTAVELINGTNTITLTLSAPITGSDTPLVSYTPGTNRIADAAANQLAAFSNKSITDNFDPTMPVVTITTDVTDPTNLTTIPFTLQFTEQVTGFVIGDITTTAGTVQNLSPAPSQPVTSYTFDVSELVDEDTLTVSIAAGAVTDVDNNLNDAFSTESITIDTTAPTVSSKSTTSAITIELETTEPIYGTAITPTDFTISGVATGATVTTVEITNDTSTITLTLSAPITDLDIPLASYIPGTNRITDAATNQLAAFTEKSIVDNFDSTMPAVTISTAVTDPTNLTTIPFTLELSEQVTGFVIGDITTTAGTVQNLSPAPSQPVTSYIFDVSELVDEDNLIVSIAAGAVTDADNNLNDAFSTESITIDTTAPTVSSASATTAITVHLETTEPIYGTAITPADFTISGVTTSTTVTTINLINGSNTITLTLSTPITGSDTPLVSYTPGTNLIIDAAANQLAAFSNLDIDNNFDPTRPTVTISTDVTDPTNLVTIPFTLQFSEQVTGFVIGDITTTAGAIQNLSPALSQSVTSYTFDVSGLVDEDNLVVSIAAGAVTDADNNLNNAFSTTPLTIDTTAPAISSQSATSAITIQLETTEPVYGTAITPTDFTISGVTTSTTVTTVEIINGSSAITLTLSAPITDLDTPLVSYTPGTNRITDAATNQLAAFSNESITDNFDPIMPAVTISTDVTDPTNLLTIPFTLELSEQVTGFVIGDIETTAGAIQNLSPAPSQSVTSYTFDVSGLVDEDNLIVSIAAGAVTDVDNNLNDAFSTEPITIDTTAPTVSSASATTAIVVELETTEPVYGTAIAPTDFTISGVATATVTLIDLINGTNTITLTLSVPITGSDTPLVSYTPGTNRITDAAGNQLAAFSNKSITDNFDSTMPAVTISTDATDPTNLVTIPFTLELSEQVTGFVIGDITTTAGIVQNLSPAPSQSVTSYIFDVSGLADEDNLIVSIAAGAVADADNNLNDAFSTEPITIDTTAPTVSSVTVTGITSVTLLISEPVSGENIPTTDFVLSDVAAITPVAVSGVDVSNSTIVLTLAAPLSTAIDTFALSYSPSNSILNITDAAGNALESFDGQLIGTPPAVSLSTSVASPTSLATIPFTARFSEYVTGFDAGDVERTSGTVQNFTFASNDINPLHIIGQFGTNDGEFDRPSNVALGGSGGPNNNNNIYISDTGNNRIQIFYSNGTYRQQFGDSGQDGAQPTAAPKGIAVNSTGYVYLADSGNHRISIYDDTDMYIDQFGGSGTDDGEFDGPTGIALDTTTNNVYVSDSGNNRIQVFDGAGRYLREFGSAGAGNAEFDNPTGIALDTTTNNVYVSDSGNNRIQVFNSTGGYVREFGSAGTGDGQFNLTGGIALYSESNSNSNNNMIYVTDTNNNRVQVFDTDGTYITQFGADDTTGNTPLDGPTDIALDSNNIYVTDAGNHRFHVFALHPVYTFDIANPANPGTLRVTIPAGAAQDVNSVDNVPSNTVSLAVGIPVPPVSGRNGSGDGESTPPSLTTSFDDDFESITINHVGISPDKFKNSYVQDPPVPVGVGTSTPIQIVLYENLSWDFVSHVELCINKLVSNNQICDSDTKIIWDQNYGNNVDNSLEIIDPNNLINDGNTSVRLTTVNRNVVIFDFDIEFAGVMDGVSDLQIYGWDTSRNALVFTVENAFDIVPGHVDVLPKLDGGADAAADGDGDKIDAVSDNTPVNSTDTTPDTSADPESASDESPTGIWTMDQLSVLKRWAGYDTESASDVKVLSEFGIAGDKIPSYVKQFTAWIINNEITRDEFVDVLHYLKDAGVLSDTGRNDLSDVYAQTVTKGPGTADESELMYEQLKSRLDNGKSGGEKSDLEVSGENQILSKGVSFGGMSVVEFTNYGASEIKTITVWLDDSSFVSFKPLDNWSSPAASEKSITFVATNPLKTNGDSVTFGLETVSSYDFIQWEAHDNDGALIESGVIISEHVPS